jgi:hypothetical protein
MSAAFKQGAHTLIDQLRGHRQLGGARANPVLAAIRGCTPAVASLQDCAEICAIGPQAPAAQVPRCAASGRSCAKSTRAQAEYALALISQQGNSCAWHSLTVRDIVRFARSRGIRRQGRGSAVNPAVCFALGVTEVDPDLPDGVESESSKRLPAGRRPNAPARR